MRPTPPIRPDRRRARTRRCPMGRDGWCAKVSLARPSGRGIEPRRLTERAQQRALLGLASTRIRYDAPHQEIAVFGDVAAHAALARRPGQIILRALAKALFLPGIKGDHEMAGEAFHQPAGPEIIETFLLERGRERAQARFLVTQRHGADHGGEYQPRWRFVLVGALWPGEARPADEPAIDAYPVPPVEGDWPLGRSVHRERGGERGEAGVKGAPCGLERRLGVPAR